MCQSEYQRGIKLDSSLQVLTAERINVIAADVQTLQVQQVAERCDSSQAGRRNKALETSSVVIQAGEKISAPVRGN